MHFKFIGLALALLLFAGGAGADAKRMLGVIEYARLLPEGILVPAKLDTGADMSSLHAREVQLVQREGRDWVLFEVDDGSDAPRRLERPLVRRVTVRSGPGVRERRVVVRMEICIGSVLREVLVNLVDRTGLNYRMLIGRNFMEGWVIVDPALQLTTVPSCRKAQSQ